MAGHKDVTPEELVERLAQDDVIREWFDECDVTIKETRAWSMRTHAALGVGTHARLTGTSVLSIGPVEMGVVGITAGKVVSVRMFPMAPYGLGRAVMAICDGEFGVA